MDPFGETVTPRDPMIDPKETRIFDEADGGDDAPRQADRSTARSGSAMDATSRAFVVELASEVTGTDAFCGRVQHLATFDGGNFTSAESLVSIIRRVLERTRPNQIDK